MKKRFNFWVYSTTIKITFLIIVVSAFLLSDLFGGTNVNFEDFKSKALLINDLSANTSLALAPESDLQQQPVIGVVTAEDGSPIPGVSVVVTGTTQGTITDNSGKYSIIIPPGSKSLTFSFIGMETKEVTIGTLTQINVIMAESIVGLDEVVVIGYGTRLKGEVTGAIAKVDAQTFEDRPITNALSALQGALPGVVVTKGSGRPGRENFDFQIRGFSSIGGSAPLVLIDGIPGDINTLNPNDIQSVTVLKDAAASIYGARAADGVLYVTTKTGKKGKPVIDYSYNYGIKRVSYLNKLANVQQYAEMYDEAMKNHGKPGTPPAVFEKIRDGADPDPVSWIPGFASLPSIYTQFDWPNEIFSKGNFQNHNLSFSGGADNSNYMISAGYTKDGGILNHGIEDKSELLNLRLNYGVSLFDRLNVDVRTAFDNRLIHEPTAAASVMGSLFIFLPQFWSPMLNPSGNYYSSWGNPAQALEEGGEAKINSHRISTNVKADLEIFKDLKLVYLMGVNLTLGDESTTMPTYTTYRWNNTTNLANRINGAIYRNSKNLFGTYTAYMEYDKTLLSNHRINVMAGVSHEQSDSESKYILGRKFLSNELFTFNLSDKTDIANMNINGSATDWALNSVFARLGYSYKSKLNVDFTARLDGSSKFAPALRYSTVLPAVSASWNLSQEDFVQSLNTFDILKLRLSWGQSGNQNLRFGNYDYIPLITISGNYPFGIPQTPTPGALATIASEARTWETVEIRNAGIDFAVFKSRLSGSFDYYIKYNNDMLVNITVPAVYGGTPPQANSGKLQTKGWDLIIAWKDKIGDFGYSIAAIVNDAKTNLLKLEGNDTYNQGLIYTREGYPLNSYFGYEFTGLIQTQEQLDAYKLLGGVPTTLGLGDAMYADLDGDGQITSFGNPEEGTTGDMKSLGDLNPRYSYSVNLKLSYKNFDFTMFLQGVGQRSGVRLGQLAEPWNRLYVTPPAWYYGKTWTPERTDAQYPRLLIGRQGNDGAYDWNNRYSKLKMTDLSYLRVKSLILAYNLPKSVAGKLKSEGIRIYFNGLDLFTFSKGTWDNTKDPEEESLFGATYPFSKVFSFGVDVRF